MPDPHSGRFDDTRGLAIPHAKSDDITDIAVAIGRLPKPIDWSAIDGEPVELVCLLVTPRTIAAPAQKQLEELMRRLRPSGS